MLLKMGGRRTDSKLLETARQKLVVAAKDAGIDLKQTFAKEGRLLRFKAGRYAHAKQFKRMGRAIKRQRTIVARIACQMERGANALSQAVRDALQGSLAKARQIVAQAASRKNYGCRLNKWKGRNCWTWCNDARVKTFRLLANAMSTNPSAAAVIAPLHQVRLMTLNSSSRCHGRPSTRASNCWRLSCSAGAGWRSTHQSRHAPAA
jgi:hypothetical protein